MSCSTSVVGIILCFGEEATDCCLIGTDPAAFNEASVGVYSKKFTLIITRVSKRAFLVSSTMLRLSRASRVDTYRSCLAILVVALLYEIS